MQCFIERGQIIKSKVAQRTRQDDDDDDAAAVDADDDGRRASVREAQAMNKFWDAFKKEKKCVDGTG